MKALRTTAIALIMWAACASLHGGSLKDRLTADLQELHEAVTLNVADSQRAAHLQSSIDALRTMTALAALLGLYHGYFNDAGLGEFTTAAVALVGPSFAVFAIVALATAFAAPLRAQWNRIAVRVAGSWIAASGLLPVAWAVGTA